MGVDLTIIPDKYPGIDGSVLAYERLGLQCRNYPLWEDISKAATESEEKILWYHDEGLSETGTNPYGEKIKYISAEKLAELWEKYGGDKEASDWDKAIFAFVRALPAGRRIYLWFH